MNIQTVAVFGASGKIGRRLVPFLVERGAAVRALVHRTPVETEGVETVNGSIADPDAVREVVRDADAVIQLATTKEDPGTFFDVSIRGTLNVLDACRGESIQQFLLLGGDAAMGIWFYPQPIPIDENHPLTAYPGHYAFTKVIEEVMANQYAIQYGLPVTILRSSWVHENDDVLRHLSLLENVRPAEPGHGFGEQPPEVMALVERGEERLPILTNADGVPYSRHLVHLDDVMQAADLMIGNPAAVGQDFNIAGPAVFNYRPAAEYLSEKTGTPTLELVCAGYHSFEINIAKARAILGYSPQNDIFTMIDRALEYRSKHGS
jgi:nucleoside-diphosphate-sugar epimerase